MIFDAVFTEITAKNVNRKSDGKEITIYEAIDHNGLKWTTSRQDLAGDINRSIGQQIQIQGREEVNGIYTNRYLEGVFPAGTIPTGVTPSAEFPIPPVIAAQVSPGLLGPMPPISGPSFAPPSPPPTPAPMPTQVPPGLPSETDWTIWRQVAAKVSATLSSTPTEFWANVDDLVHYFAFGVKPQPEPIGGTYTPAPANAVSLPQPPSRQFIPEGVPQPAGQFVDDDIPF